MHSWLRYNKTHGGTEPHAEMPNQYYSIWKPKKQTKNAKRRPSTSAKWLYNTITARRPYESPGYDTIRYDLSCRQVNLTAHLILIKKIPNTRNENGTVHKMCTQTHKHTLPRTRRLAKKETHYRTCHRKPTRNPTRSGHRNIARATTSIEAQAAHPWVVVVLLCRCRCHRCVGAVDEKRPPKPPLGWYVFVFGTCIRALPA